MVESKFDLTRLDTTALLAEVKQLQSNRAYRDHHNLFFVEGIRNFLRLAEANFNDLAASKKTAKFEIAAIIYSDRLLTMTPARQLVRRLRRNGTHTIKLTPEKFRAISHTAKASGIATIVRQNWTKLHQIAPHKTLCWIALERVRSPGNLGTLIRSSEAIGGSGFIFLGNSIDPFASEVIRASMGALFNQQYIRTSYKSLAHWLRRHQCRVVGASVAGKVDFHHFCYPKSPILFLGEERKGLSSQQQDFCQHLIRIPMVGQADSLNLAVAGSLLLYEVYRTRYTTNQK